MSLLELPVDYPRIKVVSSFAELIAARLAAPINAICWRRELAGDFDELIRLLPAHEEITPIDEACLSSLTLSPAGQEARATLLADRRRLAELGALPVLETIRSYRQDAADAIIATDVLSFHADSAPCEADTFLCSYNAPCTEGLRNDEAERRIDDPQTRARLLQEFGGEEGPAFREYLAECCYDLHYSARPHARPFSFGIGHLWRIAVDYPDSPTMPCVHRAPAMLPGAAPRLLLIC